MAQQKGANAREMQSTPGVPQAKSTTGVLGTANGTGAFSNSARHSGRASVESGAHLSLGGKKNEFKTSNQSFFKWIQPVQRPKA